MAARSIASLTLGFGLVSIPVKVYSATEASASIGFNLLTKDGSRVKQQYISVKTQQVVERADMVKGYEFDKDHFVIFTPDELKALEAEASHVIDIVAFVPDKAIDPIYYDRAYYLGPDKRGAKPYSLLMQAMRKTKRCALAKWAWKSKQYVVQVRPAEDGLVLQQLLYADEVRTMRELDIETVPVSDAEVQLATQLIEQISVDNYDPTQFKDDEKERILAAIDQKIAGKKIVAAELPEGSTGAGGQVIDIMDALRASLAKKGGGAPRPASKAAAPAASELKERKPARRAAAAPAPAAAPARARARK
ncbi:MAG: Ku protein [Rhizobacter sp.]|nr:Ku protein [Rhizobacter sp.]